MPKIIKLFEGISYSAGKFTTQETDNNICATTQGVIYENLILGENKTSPYAKSLYMTGIGLQAEVKNANGRFYPLHEISNAVRLLKESIIRTGPVPGELDHPKDRIQTLLTETSHAIVDINMRGNDGMVKMQILPYTPKGIVAYNLVSHGHIKCGVSTRGTGAVNESIVHDFTLLSIDIVATPSAPNAYPQTVYENINDSMDRYKSGIESQKLASYMLEGEDTQKHLVQSIHKLTKEMIEKSFKK